MINRRTLAEYIVANVDREPKKTVAMVAAWLVAHGRQRELRYIIQDVARQLRARGQVWARVTTAHALSASSQDDVKELVRRQTGAREVTLHVDVDPRHIGGIKIELPGGGSLDARIHAQLSQFVQGVA